MRADTDQQLTLKELTVETANAAVAFIARHATDRADLVDLLDKIQPRPHTPTAAAVQRRALPRRSA